MPSGYVRGIAQDLNGYLWLATYSGLVRFDGLRFVPFVVDNQPVLAGEDLSALLIARDGRIWVGSVTNGVTQLIDDRIVNYRRRRPSPID